MNTPVIVHGLVEENGKTVKENNLEKKHPIPLGALVEIVSNDPIFEEECPRSGLRLFVTQLTRDCDGTPLYGLSHNKTAGEQLVLTEEQLKNEQRGSIDHALTLWQVARLSGSIITGFPEESLKVIKLPD